MSADRAGAGSRRFVTIRAAIGASIVLVPTAACSSGEDASLDVAEIGEIAGTGSAARTTAPASTRGTTATTGTVAVTLDPVPASSLAASQVTASTVSRPPTPPPCTADEVAVWTAQVRANGDGVDAALRLANVGDRWCEADISASPRLDSDIEPDVWLEPGEWAELVVGPTGDECDRPEVVTSAQLAVGEQVVVAPTTALVPCGWAFTSFFPLDPPSAGCTDLAAAVSGAWLVVTNESTVTCTIGELTGAGRRGIAPRQPAEPSIIALAPGDLAGFALRPADDCTADAVPLDFAGGPIVEVEFEPCVRVELGAARPVLAGASGLLGEVDRGAPVDVDAILARLAPTAAP